jgi:hypothetical protein
LYLEVRGRGEEEATFVFEEIAHPRPAGQDKLSHILDDLGLFLGGESSEPLGETLRENLGQSGGCLKPIEETGWVTRGFGRTTLPCRDKRIR